MKSTLKCGLSLMGRLLVLLLLEFFLVLSMIVVCGMIFNENANAVLAGTGKAVFLGVSQLFGFIIMALFVYSPNYQQGFKDSNMVRTGHMEEDKLKGLKTGLIANIPFMLMLVGLLVCALGAFPNMPLSIYRLSNSHFYGFIEIIGGKVATAAGLHAWQFVLLFVLQLIVPVISAAAYIMGYKGIDVVEKIIYVKREEK